MKKLNFFIMLLFCINSFSQIENLKTSIEESDIKMLSTSKSIGDVTIFVTNANNKKVSVAISLYVKDSIYSQFEINARKLNIMILNSYYGAMYSCKNKYSFEPKKIDIFFWNEKQIWCCTTEFTAQNDYGGTKVGTKKAYFETNGETEISEMDLIMREMSRKEQEKKNAKKDRKKNRNKEE